MQHVQRAGASNRTADELSEVFVLDTIDLVREWSADHALLNRATALETALGTLLWADGYSRWLSDDDETSQPEFLQDLVRDAEYLLADIGLGVEWDDGYIICDADDWDEDGSLRDCHDLPDPNKYPIGRPIPYGQD